MPRNLFKLINFRGFIGLISTFSFYLAIDILPLSLGVTLYYTTPIMTALICYIFLGEKLAKLEVLSIFSASFGVIILTKPEWIFSHMKED